jgi:hypothetical protein
MPGLDPGIHDLRLEMKASGMAGPRVIRHSGESRNPEAARTAFVSLDTGLRRYDEPFSPPAQPGR